MMKQFSNQFLLFSVATLLLFSCSGKVDPYIGWQVYRGDNSSSCYSVLDQINRGNVTQLEKAWEFHTGDAIQKDRSVLECNPLFSHGMLFILSPQMKVMALHPST